MPPNKNMDPLSSSFLPKHHHPIHVASFTAHNFVSTRRTQPLTTFNLFKIHHPTLASSKKQAALGRRKSQFFYFLAGVLNRLDDLTCTFLDPHRHPTSDPDHVFSHNHAPVVGELPPTACEVLDGILPGCLDGVYICNSPNPQFFPTGPYHFVDGDGMLHMIKISQGKATFCSRYVKTHKYLMEQQFGRPIVPSAFSSFNGITATFARVLIFLARILVGQFNVLTNGCGTANTSLAMIGGRLFALCEYDLPYEVKPTSDGDIITLGRSDFHSDEHFLNMTAHPKIDRETGETFAFRFNFTRPYLTMFRINSRGRKEKDVPIYSIEETTCIHDFAITKNYAIFTDSQLVVNPRWILEGRSPLGVAFDKVPRVGIIPRYAEDDSEMQWIDVPGFNMFHCLNAWEVGDEEAIVMVSSNIVGIGKFMEGQIESVPTTLEKMTINLKTKSVKRHQLSTKSLDFGVVNPAYASKKNRYAYAAIFDGKTTIGLVKLDLSAARSGDCVVASRLYGPGCFGSGEPAFIARELHDPEGATEDYGYLMTYVHDDNTGESKFVVMETKSPTLEVVAAVKLPRRVPFAFHGIFLSQPDLDTLL